MVSIEQDDGRTMILLQPNRSASWQQTRHFLYLLGGITLLVGVVWSLAGAWVVLPFAGLEVMVLTYVMCRVSYLTYQSQVIVIDKHQVLVEQGVDAPTQRWQFQRPDVHINVIEANNPIDCMVLSLVQSERELIIGGFLNQDDLKLARQALTQSGLPICSDKWWQSSKM